MTTTALPCEQTGLSDSGLANPDPHVVTVWSDIGCPWAGLALHTLHDAATECSVDLLIDYRVFPLELAHADPLTERSVRCSCSRVRSSA
jgi:predicted DsbA family dithiol-disulfide isomerase